MEPMIDLHMHSDRSADGEFPPEALVAMAFEAGLDYIALADHNRTDGVAPAIDAARGTGVRVIPGVELDCRHGDLELHLLGYFIDHADRRYHDLWADIAAKERAASGSRIELVRSLGVAVPDDGIRKLAADGIVTGEIIAEIAMTESANDANPLLAPYRQGGARSDNPFVNFYWDHCSAGKPAHVPVAFMTLPEAVRLIRDTGGVPVLAHPGQSLKNREDALPDIVRQGVSGLEAYSSYHSPEQNRFWRETAEKLELFTTCGSDFHGKTKPSIALGRHGAGADMGRMLADLLAAAQETNNA